VTSTLNFEVDYHNRGTSTSNFEVPSRLTPNLTLNFKVPSGGHQLELRTSKFQLDGHQLELRLQSPNRQRKSVDFGLFKVRNFEVPKSETLEFLEVRLPCPELLHICFGLSLAHYYHITVLHV
jgi:hypothetical protein